MKIYSLPPELPPPTPDYGNYDRAKEQADEAAHMAQVKQWLIANGYTGPRTGDILSEPFADGSANYMFGDGGRRSCLIHLPYGDGWHSPNVAYLPKAEVIRRIDSSKRIAELFAGKGQEDV